MDIDSSPIQYDTQIAAITDAGGALRVYFLGSDGNLYELAFVSGQWGTTNLNRDLPGAPKPVTGSPIAAVAVPGSLPCVYYVGSVGSDSHLIEIQWNDGSGGMTDLSQYTETPDALTGAMIAAIPGQGGAPQVYSVLEGGDLYAFAFEQGAWSATDLTTQIPSPQPVSGSAIAAAARPDGSLLVSYVAGGGDLYLLTWAGTWEAIDLNTEVVASEKPVTGTTIAALAGVRRAAHVFYIGGTGDLYEFAWAREEWINSDLTSDASAPQPVLPTAVAGSAIAAITVSDGTIRVYFSGVDGDIHELASSGTGGGWADADVTADSGAEKPQGPPPPPSRKPVPCTAIAATPTADGAPRVYFIGLDGYLYDLELGWRSRQLA